MEGKIKELLPASGGGFAEGDFHLALGDIDKGGRGVRGGQGWGVGARLGAGALGPCRSALRYSQKHTHRACLHEDLAARPSLTRARETAINAPQAWRRKGGGGGERGQGGMGISPKLDGGLGSRDPPGASLLSLSFSLSLSLCDLLCDLEESTCPLCALPIISPFCSQPGGPYSLGVLTEWKVLAQSHPAMETEALSSGAPYQRPVRASRWRTKATAATSSQGSVPRGLRSPSSPSGPFL